VAAVVPPNTIIMEGRWTNVVMGTPPSNIARRIKDIPATTPTTLAMSTKTYLPT